MGCFHAALCNSPCRDKIVINNHRYILWEKQYENYPAILDERAYEGIKAGDYHFAQKIDGRISKDLLRKLDVLD